MPKFPLHLKLSVIDPNTGQQKGNALTVVMEHTDDWHMLMHLFHEAERLEKENDMRHWSANAYPIPRQ